MKLIRVFIRDNRLSLHIRIQLTDTRFNDAKDITITDRNNGNHFLTRIEIIIQEQEPVIDSKEVYLIIGLPTVRIG